MAKKSNKTTHVLNLLTNRTGLSADGLENTALPKEKSVKKPFEDSAGKAADESPAVSVAAAGAVLDVSEKIRINLEKIERSLSRQNREQEGQGSGY